MIKLECKHKEGSCIAKQSIRLSRAECESLIRGEYAFLLSRREPFARRMFAEFATKCLRPRVIVDYTRGGLRLPR